MSVSGETKSYGEMIRRVRYLEAENERLREELEDAHLARIEAQNPGIDIDRVRRERAARRP